jgi:7-cyano-7-deazaguanine tRNA-ribosyltransferase
MLIVAGLSLKNLQPRVWDKTSPHYLPELKAVMVSFGDFYQMPARMKKAMDTGLRDYLGVPKGVSVYLDNGAFYFLRTGGQAAREAYNEFVEKAQPDWYPIAFDAIPMPEMSEAEKRKCFESTMAANCAYVDDGYVPVIHVGTYLNEYVAAVRGNKNFAHKTRIALGGIVPNLLRAPKAMAYDTILDHLRLVRKTFSTKHLHVFGIGGTATVHLAALLGVDSADSSGWRNRAARGIVQLPGSGDRMVSNLGKWRGRSPSKDEWAVLKRCRCPACRKLGIVGLKMRGLKGFCNRATHNLQVLLGEAEWVRNRIAAGSYARAYGRRLDNTVYRPLIKKLVARLPRQS